MGRIGLTKGSYLLESAEDTVAFGKKAAQEISPGTVLALYGDLGAGKTTFVQGLALGLGILEPVQSPTFILLNLYESLAHFDLYRLEGEKDFLAMGFSEYFSDEYISVFEWPEKILSLLPKNTLHIHFHHQDFKRIAEVHF